MASWHDIESARNQWVDAPLDDAALVQLLEVAKGQVIAYAPALPEPGEGDDPAIPEHYRVGQLMQARNIWNAQKVDAASGGMGEGEYVVRPHPLDWMVKQVLRPRKGVPRVR